jgi:hypothetical protein
MQTCTVYGVYVGRAGWGGDAGAHRAAGRAQPGGQPHGGARRRPQVPGARDAASAGGEPMRLEILISAPFREA